MISDPALRNGRSRGGRMDDDIAGATALEIAESVRRLLDRGALAPGDALPPVRTLADRLGVNRNTVMAAYRQLAQRRRRRVAGRGGTRVAEPRPRSPGGLRERQHPARRRHRQSGPRSHPRSVGRARTHRRPARPLRRARHRPRPGVVGDRVDPRGHGPGPRVPPHDHQRRVGRRRAAPRAGPHTRRRGGDSKTRASSRASTRSASAATDPSRSPSTTRG